MKGCIFGFVRGILRPRCPSKQNLVGQTVCRGLGSGSSGLPGARGGGGGWLSSSQSWDCCDGPSLEDGMIYVSNMDPSME